MIHQITKTTAILAFSALTVMPAMAQEKEVDDKYVENDVVSLPAKKDSHSVPEPETFY